LQVTREDRECDAAHVRTMEAEYFESESDEDAA
jgi:hypothetical protein